MKFTLSWLKDHLTTSAGLDEICDKLNMIGLEVEDVFDPSEIYKDFTICEVSSIKKHPDADKLKICTLNTINGIQDVVCGANNVKEGMKAVFAPEGSYIPGLSMTLQATKIRGVKSSGMLLSERELSLSDEHDGILELDPKSQIGNNIYDQINKSDPVIEISITPNRSDALGVRGIARDLSAANIGKLKPLKATKIIGKYDIQKEIKINKDVESNIYASFRLIKNIKNCESPRWLKNRLEAIGLRPINALVDVTNYLTYDLNRPLHVFDYDKINKGLEIRKAKAGEKILALDDKEYNLSRSHTIFSDDNNPESIAGIIGGKRTGCNMDTVNVLVESAVWDKINIADTGRELNINSDARYRNERGIDSGFNNSGLDKAIEMIKEICGGEISNIKSVGKPLKRQEKINFNFDEVSRLLGVSFKKSDINQILTGLGFSLSEKNNKIEITVPSWRHDISENACIVEEIMRIKGTDNIKPIPLKKSVGVASKKINRAQKIRFNIKRILASRGMMETVSYSFISDKIAKLFYQVNDDLRLLNPISMELNVMRQLLMPSLLLSVKRNLDKGQKDISLFEVSNCYSGVNPEDQFEFASGVRLGKAISHGGNTDWRGNSRDYDSFDAKEDIITILRSEGIDDSNYKITQDAPKYYHPGKSGVIRQGPMNILGHFGEIHPTILTDLDIDTPIFAFEIFLDKISSKTRNKLRVRPGFTISNFMPVSRDFAFIVDKDTKAEEILNVIKRIKNTMIEDIKIFDIYSGKNIPKNKKSIGVNVIIQPYEKTLTDLEIEEISRMIISEVGNKFEAEIRS
ncbi:MAG: phenylalanine--tRNA ligase subunit beta [Pseudomonadota bacterium]|nr:phenylalanine--tRNA ligase subunit beta [Pseudomonadota bacterium]